MKSEDYINKIIEGTGLSKKDIEDLVEEKKQELKGLISEEGALFVIAKELGIEVSSSNKALLSDIELNVSDITANMKNIMLVGRINEIYNVSKFEKNGGVDGFVGSFLLNDGYGNIRIVLWDDNVKVFNDDRFKINEMVKIINGYAKEGRYGNLEVHIGKMGKIEISPEDVDYKKFPKVTENFININEIKEGMYSASVEGKISNLFPVKEFTKKNGEKGKLQSIILRDTTGTVRIVFWNGDIVKTKDLVIDDYVAISNLTVRKNTYTSDSFDLHATRQTSISRKDKELELNAELVENIKDLQNKDNIISFQGVITSIDDLKNVNLKSGEEVSLLNFFISDNTGSIRVNAWRGIAEELAKNLKVNDGIFLKNVLVKYNDFSRRTEVSLISDSIIEKKALDYADLKIQDTSKIEPVKKFSDNFTDIAFIQSSGFFQVKGFFPREFSKIRLYEACSICNKKYENCTCEEKGIKKAKMIINQLFEDQTGRIRVTFIGDIAERFIGVSAEEIKDLIDTPDYENFLNKKSSQIVGRDLLIKGRAKFNDFTNNYEIMASDFQELNIKEELDKIVKEIEN